MAEHTGKGDILAACELPAWAAGSGPSADIVISTRASLSRNLAGTRFPHRADAASKQRVLDDVVEAAESAGRQLGLSLQPYLATGMANIERQALWEAYQIHFESTPSPEHSGLILSADRRVSVVVNGEDHVRFMCLLSGLSVHDTYETAACVADAFGQFLSYARHPHFEYLTARPSLVGTGMRICVLAHLAGLHKVGRLTEVLRSTGDLEAATGSLLPADGRSQEGLMEVANRRTAGVSGAEVVANLEETVGRLLSFEREAREVLMRDRRQEMVDETCRALATLRNARLLSSAEALAHVSTLRLGVAVGIVRGLDVRRLNGLSLMVAPGLLQTRAGRVLPENERRALRASIVRAKLKER